MTPERDLPAARRHDRAAWETAEVDRSAVEAREVEAAGLLLEEYHVTRYLNPPVDTPYSLEYAFALLGDLHGLTALDFGCGGGGNSVVLRAKGAKVIALDISPHLLEVTRKRLATHRLDSDTDYVLASGHQMPIPDASVDVVFGAAILHHLDLGQAAAEVKRVLRPSGFAVFVEPVRDAWLYVLLRRLFPNRSEDISPFEYPLSSAQLDAFRSGFTSGPRRRFLLPGTIIMGKVGLPESAIRLSRTLDRALLRSIPSLDRWATVEVFQIGLSRGP